MEDLHCRSQVICRSVDKRVDGLRGTGYVRVESVGVLLESWRW